MTRSQPRTTTQLSRRGALGLLAATSIVAGGTVLTGSAAAWAAQGGAGTGQPQPGPVPRALRPGGELDQLIEREAARDEFSGTVLLAHRGRAVLARACGMADKALAVPVTIDTRFDLASVTKAMTATAVAQLAQRGAIAFDATLGSYLDGFPAAVAGTVTVHQLLTMTSGMDNYYLDPAWYPQSTQWTSPEQVFDGTMAVIRRQPLRFTPGTGYNYSNSGFVLLGAIVAQVSGQSYWDYMRRHVFGPAGMTSTDFNTRPHVLRLLADGELAHAYAAPRNGGPRVDVSGNPMYIGLPDGNNGPQTTAPDVVRFATALRDGTLLTGAYAHLILAGRYPLTPPAGAIPPRQSWMSGYGLEDTIANNRHILSHAGNGPGIANNLDIFPALDWTAVVLSNYDLVPFGTTTEQTPIVELERQLVTEQAG